MIDLLIDSISAIKEYLTTDEGQDEVAHFIRYLRNAVPSDYTQLCNAADQGLSNDPWGSKKLNALMKVLNRFMVECPPGHDIGHICRDGLAGMALIQNDPYIQKANYVSDVVAGLLAAAFHDIGNSVTVRYQDTLRKCGHGEIGAWIVYMISKKMDILDNHLALLTAYAIAAHTNYQELVAVKVPEGFFREPYWADLWEDMGKPIGIAIQLPRMVDRLDNNGITLFTRHLLAMCDGSQYENTQDISAGEFFKIDETKLKALLKPVVESTPGLTTLQHMLNYANSNFGQSVYSKNDHLFPAFSKMMERKVLETKDFVRIVTKEYIDHETTTYVQLYEKASIKGFLRSVSGSSKFESVWDVLVQIWDNLSNEERRHWSTAFYFAQSTYLKWLNDLFELVGNQNKELAKELVDRSI